MLATQMNLFPNGLKSKWHRLVGMNLGIRRDLVIENIYYKKHTGFIQIAHRGLALWVQAKFGDLFITLRKATEL